MASPNESKLSSTSPQLLSIHDIASWQIPHLVSSTSVRAALPALQRGAVWKVRQTEALWDSLLRGFPIGSFLVAPLDPSRGIQNHPLADGSPPALPYTHHFLDGQQRATALALGFLNPWQHRPSNAWPVLWVDLAPPPANSDLDYVFRVLTRSHPWGYRLSRPDTRLEASQMRQALAAYKDASPQLESKRPTELPLMHTWPWDAKAPVPVPLLIEAILAGGDTAANLLKALATLPFWQNEQAVNSTGNWQALVADALAGANPSLQERFDHLVDGMRPALGDKPAYRVPVIVVPQIAASGPLDARLEAATRQDPIETLFIRINAGGTPLEGEELMYSTLKSIWPEAPAVIDALSSRLASPARLVMLIARLILAEDTKGNNPPSTPDVGRFRRLIHGADPACPDFYNRLRDFADQDATLFDWARKMLTDGDHGLPPVLCANLARRSPDVMFLFLHWLRRLRRAGFGLETLSDCARRRILGVLTALSWFAPDSGRCLTALWNSIQHLNDDQLPNFFSRCYLKPLFELTPRGDFHLLPIPSPEVLKKAIDNTILSARGIYGGFGNPEHDFWKKWRWYERFAGRLTNDLTQFYKSAVGDLWQSHYQDGDTAANSSAKHLEAWTAFIDKLWNERRLLLYAQRQWLVEWFPDYDPTAPDQLEDTDRPWDFDHIHPEKLVRRHWHIPPIIKDWHSSIGNLRAWPLEANRSDGANTPADKLTQTNPTLARYGLDSPYKIRNASHIDEDWPYWQACVPNQPNYPHSYLADPAIYGACRQALVRAITTRFVKLYANWYQSLKLGDWVE